jgi:hypothetical protein
MENERYRRIEALKAEQQKATEEELTIRSESFKMASIATEEERNRRVKEIEASHQSDNMERKMRQQWADSQMVQEQQARLIQSEGAMIAMQKRLTKNIRSFIKVKI